MKGQVKVFSILAIILFCIVSDQVTKKIVTALTSFQLTGQSLEKLTSEGLPDEVINQLETIRNQEVTGKEEFLAILKSTIGNEQTVRYKSLILTYAVARIKSSSSISYWGDFFRFQYAENTGAMLGFGSDLPDGLRFWLLTVLVGVLLLALLIFLFISQKLTTPQMIALSLICGGGVSNFIDRVMNDGRVVDFMNMGIGWLRTGIFNVADVLIMIGLGMILVFGEWSRKKEAAEPADKRGWNK